MIVHLPIFCKGNPRLLRQLRFAIERRDPRVIGVCVYRLLSRWVVDTEDFRNYLLSETAAFTGHENGSTPVAPGDRNSKQEKFSWKM